jgi:hypothetical protein
MAVGLGGCATTQNAEQLEQLHMNAPIKIVVMESPISIDPERLQTVLAPDIKPGLPASAKLIVQGQIHAQEYAQASMKEALREQAGLDFVASTEKESQAVDMIRRRKLESAITQDEANRLRAITGADALLRFGITDYGLTPKSWRKGYITFEVTSTLGLGAAIAYSGSAAAKAAAGAYLAQEAVEESAEAYAGFWGLDVVSRPVRIEAALVRLNPVATVWETSDTGLSDISLSRLTRKVSSVERSNQLDQSTKKAIDDVVSALAHALGHISAPRARATPADGSG